MKKKQKFIIIFSLTSPHSKLTRHVILINFSTFLRFYWKILTFFVIWVKIQCCVKTTLKMMPKNAFSGLIINPKILWKIWLYMIGYWLQKSINFFRICWKKLNIWKNFVIYNIFVSFHLFWYSWYIFVKLFLYFQIVQNF